jgi:predicted dehydrogenase
MIKIAQIGCGYWGPNLLRNFSALNNCHLSHVVEISRDRQQYLFSNFPHIDHSKSYNQILEDSSIDAVVIASPANLHFEQAKQALLYNKHVFVEKPMATKIEEVKKLSELANDRKLTLMSGHTFLYNDAVRFVKEKIDKGELGDIRYIYSQRLNLGRIRSDVDALWNFAPHDVSIVQYWLGEQEPIEITRSGMGFIQNGINDVVFLNLRYESTLVNIHVSWLDPLKTRKMVVVGSKKMIVYDDVAEDKITIYDKGIDKYSNLGENMDFDNKSNTSFHLRSGDVWIPKITYKEPLRTEAKHFISCIATGQEPLSGSRHSINVVRILEQASISNCK